MKNEVNESKILRQNGFSKVRNSTKWTKGTWTVRFLTSQIEAYQDLSINNYKYICLPDSEENLKNILENIN